MDFKMKNAFVQEINKIGAYFLFIWANTPVLGRGLPADVFSGSCEGHMLWWTGIMSCVTDSDSLRE